MDGLQLALGEATLASFLVALARTAGFVLVTPPFNTRAVPGRARAAVAVALAVPLTAWVRPHAPSLTGIDLLLHAVLQLLTGVSLGFLVLVAVSAIQAAGELIDLVGGFSLSVAMDPLLMVQSSVMGRLHQLLAVTLLMAGDGHLMVLTGLATGLRADPLAVLGPGDLAAAVTADVAAMVVAALRIAAPIMAVMFVVDVALGLLTRIAPALNAFVLGFPLKILFTLLLVGLVVVRLPAALTAGLERAVESGMRLVGAG